MSLHFCDGCATLDRVTQTLDYSTPKGEATTPGSALAARFGRAFSGIIGALIGLFLVLIIFGVWRPQRFLSSVNLLNVLRYNYHFVVAAVGATFVIITAGIDLSAGSVMAFSCVACAMAAKGFSIPSYDLGQGITIADGVALVCALCAAGHMLQRGATQGRAAAIAAAAGAVGLVVSGA